MIERKSKFLEDVKKITSRQKKKKFNYTQAIA